jgi:hypothetical protein
MLCIVTHVTVTVRSLHKTPAKMSLCALAGLRSESFPYRTPAPFHSALVRQLGSVGTAFDISGSEVANAEVGSKSDGEQGGHWPRMPMESRSWVDLELVPACEYLSEGDRSNKEATERQTEQR